MTTAGKLVSRLVGRGWTVAVAESLTGGAVASEIVSVPGASATLLGAIVAYATPLKHTLLGVDDALLAEHGPVHPQVASQMADGVRRAVQIDGRTADVGIATTGVAGPDPQGGQPVGTVHIGVATPDGCWVTSFRFEGDRAAIRQQTTEEALAQGLRRCEPRE